MIITITFSLLLTYTNCADQLYLNEASKLIPQYQQIDQEYRVMQTVDNAIVQYNLIDVQKDKFLRADLLITNPRANFTLDIHCTKISSNGNVTYQDLNGQYLGKSYRTISLPQYTFKENDILYVEISVAKDALPYEYTLILKSTDKYQCNRNCLSFECLEEKQICNCPETKLDLDCSTSGQSLTLNQQYPVPVLKDSQYLYYQMTEQMNELVLEISLYPNVTTYTEASIKILFENFEVGLPSDNYYDLEFHYQSSEEIKQFIIDTSSLKYDQDLKRYQRLIISLSSDQGYFIISINDSVEEESSDTLPLYYALGGAAFLLIIIIGSCYYGYKRNKGRSQRIEQQQQQQQQQQEQQSLNLQTNIQSLAFCSYKEILNQLLLKKPNLKVNEQCSVCLVDYQETSECCVTPCFHVFHQQCLDYWLNKHNNCPLCREGLPIPVQIKKSQHDIEEIRAVNLFI